MLNQRTKKVNEQDIETKDGKEVIDLCNEIQTMTGNSWKDNQERKQNNHDKEKSETIARKRNKNRTRKDSQVQETIEDKVSMMCCENLDESQDKEPDKEVRGEDESLDNDNEK